MLKEQKNLLEYLKTEPFELEESSYDSVLGMFSFLYATHHNFENGYMREKFRQLDPYLQLLPEEERKQLRMLFVKIYAENEKLAFQEGVRLGYRLHEEFNDSSD